MHFGYHDMIQLHMASPALSNAHEADRGSIRLRTLQPYCIHPYEHMAVLLYAHARHEPIYIYLPSLGTSGGSPPAGVKLEVASAAVVIYVVLPDIRGASLLNNSS